MLSVWVVSVSAVKFADAPDVCVFHKHHETKRIKAQKDLKSMADSLHKEVRSGFSQYQSAVIDIKRILDQSLTTDNLKQVRNKLQSLRNDIENSMDVSMGYTTSPIGTINQMINFIDNLIGTC